ncbi:hypothetical protein [Peribacillus frigoritolerans]|uniref:hypothetical protein n=1 Tax=Peribacillus frigoritolerans TaxID=450367 RepID=UPI002EAAEE55|nr:hypothetical protein [Peribacillus frigoritolerans]
MELKEAIYNRRSVRYFMDKKIDQETLKVQAGEEDTLSKKDQKELSISSKMWEYYTGIPGWLPIV